MPCYDERDSPEYMLAETVAECKRRFRHNSPVAEMLCTAMALLEHKSMLDRLTPQMLAWWEEHKARDQNKVR